MKKILIGIGLSLMLISSVYSANSSITGSIVVEDLTSLKIDQNLEDVAIRQTALNVLTDVISGVNEYVLTKDTTTGNALWKAVTTAINSLSDVIITSPQDNEVLTYSGGNWINASVAGGGGSNFATNKATTAGTWNALSGLGGATNVQVTVDNTLLTEGITKVKTDNGVYETVEVGERFTGITEATSTVDVAIEQTTKTIDFLGEASFFSLSDSTQPYSTRLSQDETKMYVLYNGTDSVYEYDLLVTGDITSAVHNGNTFSFATQDTQPYAIEFKPDGTKMYVIGVNNDTVFEYNLSIAWDVTSASYSGNSFSVATQSTNPIDMFFKKDDGLKLYIIEAGNDTVFQYDLTVAWDVTSASYANKSLITTAEDNNAQSITFDPTGQYFYMAGTGSDSINKYNLSTAWDISTGVFKEKSFLISLPSSISWSSDGRVLYYNDTNAARQRDITKAWHVMAYYEEKSFDYSSYAGTVRAINIEDEGTKLYITDYGDNVIEQFTLTTPYDVNTAVLANKSFDFTPYGSVPLGVRFAPDGKKLWMLDNASNLIREFRLDVAWDADTIVYNNKFKTVTAGTLYGFDFNLDGTKIFILDNALDTILQLDLSSAYDITTAIDSGKSYSVGSQETSPTSIFFSKYDEVFWVVGQTGDDILEYSYNNDIDTASFQAESSSFVALMPAVTDIFFAKQNTKIYLTGTTNDTIYQYDNPGLVTGTSFSSVNY